LQSLNHHYDIIPTAGITSRATWRANANPKTSSFTNSDCWEYQLVCSSTWWHLCKTVHCKAADHSGSQQTVFVFGALSLHFQQALELSKNTVTVGTGWETAVRDTTSSDTRDTPLRNGQCASARFLY